MADLKFRSSVGTDHFPLVKDVVTLPYAPSLGEASHPDAAKYEHFPPTQEEVFAYEDGSLGLGLFSAPDFSQRRFDFTSGVDRRFGGKGMLWGAWVPVGLAPTPATLGFNGPFKAHAQWQGNEMVAAGRAIYKLNQTTVQWELWDDHAVTGDMTPLIPSMVVHDNKLIVQWEGHAYFHIFTDPANNATVTHNAVFAAAVYRFTVNGSSLYANVLANNKVYFNDDPTEVTLANWTLLTAGDTSFDMNEMWSGPYVQMGKDDGLYNFSKDNTDGKADVAIPMKDTPSDSNFRHHAFLGDWVLTSVETGGRNLVGYNLVTGAVERRGLHPRDIGPDTPEIGGAVYGMCNSGDRTRLYMVVLNDSVPTAGRNFYLLEVSEREGQLVYHPIQGYNIGPSELILIHAAGNVSAPTIWWFIGAAPYQALYLRLPKFGSSPDQDPTYPFDTGTDNWEITPWITGNFVDLVDGLYYIQVQTEQCSATATIRIDYQFDTGTDATGWTVLTTITTNGWSGQINWPYNTSCKRFRFRIRYYSSSSATTPILRKIVGHGRLLPPGLRMVQAVIKCEKDNLDSIKSQRDAFLAHAGQDGLIEISIGNDFPLIFLGTIPRSSITERITLSSNEPVVEIQFVLLEALGESPP